MAAVRSGAVKASRRLIKAMDYIEKKLSAPDVFVDTARIDKAVELIERYFEMKLLDWELFVLALVHCYHKSDDTVVFSEFFIMMGRGNGKNGFISALAWYLTTKYHGIKGYNVDIIANSEDQAMTSFNDIYEVLERWWDKLKRFFYKSKEIIKNLDTGSYIKFNTSNARTKDGKRSACLIFDERHEYENSAQIGVFSSGFGKRKHSRIFSITTNGYVREGVLDDDLRMADDVLNGVITDLGFCPLIYEMNSDEECDDPELWEEANPSIRYFPELKKEIDRAAVKKKYDKQTELDFYTKRMNRPRTNMEVAVTEWEKIAATNKPLPDLKGWSCTVGIDFASLRDWAAVNFHFRKGDHRFDFGRRWVCLRSPDISRIKAPWDAWETCVPVDEVEIPPSLLTDYIKETAIYYNLKKIALDNFRFALMKNALEKIGFDPKERKNVYLVRPSDIMKVQPVIDSCFNKGLFYWGDDPALRWAVNNTKLVRSGKKEGTDTGNYYYSKIEGKSRKTDPFMALVAAMVIEDELGTGECVFDDLPVITG
jgi:phage terminase large subunit-like protein